MTEFVTISLPAEHGSVCRQQNSLRAGHTLYIIKTVMKEKRAGHENDAKSKRKGMRENENCQSKGLR